MNEDHDLTDRLAQYLATDGTPAPGLERRVMEHVERSHRGRRLALRTAGPVFVTAVAAAFLVVVTLSHVRTTLGPSPAPAPSVVAPRTMITLGIADDGRTVHVPVGTGIRVHMDGRGPYSWRPVVSDSPAVRVTQTAAGPTAPLDAALLAEDVGTANVHAAEVLFCPSPHPHGCSEAPEATDVWKITIVVDPAGSPSPSPTAAAPIPVPALTEAQLLAVAKATYFSIPIPNTAGLRQLATCESTDSTYNACPFTADFVHRLTAASASEKPGNYYVVLCQCQQYPYAPSSYVATVTPTGGTVTVTIPLAQPDVLPVRSTEILVLTITNQGGIALVQDIASDITSCPGHLHSITDTTPTSPCP